MVETDCETALQLLRDGVPPPYSLCELVLGINDVLKPPCDIQWHKISRSVKRAADRLAKLGATSSVVCEIFKEPPPADHI